MKGNSMQYNDTCSNCSKRIPNMKNDVTTSVIGGRMIKENSGSFHTESQHPSKNTSNYIPGISDNKNTASVNNLPSAQKMPMNMTESIGIMPENDIMNSSDLSGAYDPSSIKYLNGFMRSQIGRNIGVEMLIGTNNIVERDGILSVVGHNYFVLHDPKTQKFSAYSFYEVKSVHVPYIVDEA